MRAINNIRLAVLWSLCLLCLLQSATQAQQNSPIVPMKDGDFWIYSYHHDIWHNNNFGARKGKQIYRVTGDTTLSGQAYKVVNASGIGEFDHFLPRFWHSDSVSFSAWDSLQCDLWFDSKDWIFWHDALERKDTNLASVSCSLIGQSDLARHTRGEASKTKREEYGKQCEVQDWTWKYNGGPADGSTISYAYDVKATSMPGVGISEYYIIRKEFITGGGEIELHTTLRLTGAYVGGVVYGDTSTVTSVATANLSPDPRFDFSINVWPNPAHEAAIFAVTGRAEKYHVELFDLNGRSAGRISEGTFDEFGYGQVENNAVNISHLASGAYIAILIVDGRARANCLMMV